MYGLGLRGEDRVKRVKIGLGVKIWLSVITFSCTASGKK
jgi:hypothetical protein